MGAAESHYLSVTFSTLVFSSSPMWCSLRLPRTSPSLRCLRPSPGTGGSFLSTLGHLNCPPSTLVTTAGPDNFRRWTLLCHTQSVWVCSFHSNTRFLLQAATAAGLAQVFFLHEACPVPGFPFAGPWTPPAHCHFIVCTHKSCLLFACEHQASQAALPCCSPLSLLCFWKHFSSQLISARRSWRSWALTVFYGCGLTPLQHLSPSEINSKSINNPIR